MWRWSHGNWDQDDGVEFPLDTQSFSDGPRTENIFLESATIPWDLFVASGGAASGSTGQLTYVATNTSQIFTRGEFDFSALGAPPASAIAGFDAVFSIDFQVAVPTTFTITGYVSTVRALDAPEVINCQYNGVVLAGDTRATPLTAGTYEIDAEHTLHPYETGSLDCSAASSGALADANTLVWEVAVNGLPEPGSALASIAACVSLASLTRRRNASRRSSAASSSARARARSCDGGSSRPRDLRSFFPSRDTRSVVGFDGGPPGFEPGDMERRSRSFS